MRLTPDDYEIQMDVWVRSWRVTAVANTRPGYMDLADITLFLPNGRQADWLWRSLTKKQQNTIERDLAATYNEQNFSHVFL